MKPKLKPCQLEPAVCEAGSDAALYCCEAGSVLLYLGFSIVSETVSASSGCKTGQYCAERDIWVVLQGLSCVEIKCLLVTSLPSLAWPLNGRYGHCSASASPFPYLASYTCFLSSLFLGLNPSLLLLHILECCMAKPMSRATLAASVQTQQNTSLFNVLAS